MADHNVTILCERAPWPHEPLDHNGTRIEASVDDHVAHVIIGCDVSAATRTERRHIFSRPLEVAVLQQPSFLWWTVQTANFVFDAPFSAAVNGSAWAKHFLATTSCRLCVVFVGDGIVQRLRMIPVPSSRWRSVMRDLSTCPAQQDQNLLSLDIAAAQIMFSASEVHRHAAPLARSQR